MSILSVPHRKAAMLLVAAYAAWCSNIVLGVSSGKILLSQVYEVAQARATISFVASLSVSSGGSITLQFPFGSNGVNGRMPLLGTMYGSAVTPQGNGEVPLHAVNLLVDGETIVYMIEDDGFTKMVINSPYTNKYYTGNIVNFDTNQWGSYNGGLISPTAAGYMLKNQPVPVEDYLPFIGTTGKCDVSNPSISRQSTSFIRNGNIIITLLDPLPAGPISVTCSGLTIFTRASTFGGLRISTSSEPSPHVANFDCPVSTQTVLHCTGVFKIGVSHVPMLYMTDGSFAWIAVKYTSRTSDAIVENTWAPTRRNFHVSHSILRSSIRVADDILLVERSSSVYANLSSSSAFSMVRDNILRGCYWFQGMSVGANAMRPYASGAYLPDATGSGPCCTQDSCNSVFQNSGLGTCPAQYDCSNGIFASYNFGLNSHSQLNSHGRFRTSPDIVEGDQRTHAFRREHSVWFRIPLGLLVSASLPLATVPFNQGLIAVYTSDSWRPAESLSNSSWMDLSGFGNHVTDIGGTNISLAKPVGAPAYIYGASTAWMKFPVGILPSADYTFVFVARYNGANSGRLFQGVNTNWFSGFWNGQAGGAHHGGCGWITQEMDASGAYINLHGRDWVIGVDRGNSFRSNGKDRTIKTSPCNVFDRLAINNGAFAFGETTDFAVQTVLVYNLKLSDADVLKVEAWLTALQPGFSPSNLQGVVGFYDARDLTACSGTCSWTPRAGFIGPLVGTATISGDGWLMQPRFISSQNSGITGDQPYTAIVAFKDIPAYPPSSIRALTHLGVPTPQKYRLQYLTDTALALSGYFSDTQIPNKGMLQNSAHFWASVYSGEKNTMLFWNGAVHSSSVCCSWNTVDSLLQVGHMDGAYLFNGGLKFVLIVNRALTNSEVAAVARWSWSAHGVGLDLMHFSPDAWTAVSIGQVYWTPPAHMQPLSRRTVRFAIDIQSSYSTSCRTILRFGAAASDPGPHLDRMIYVEIKPNTKGLHFSMTRSTLDQEIAFTCPTQLSGHTLVTLVYTRTSVSVYLNNVLQTDINCRYSNPSIAIADTDNSRIARQNGVCTGQGGFTLRSLQLLEYAMTDFESRTPDIISVTPQLLLASHSSVTIIGSPFVVGAACNALFLDGSVSTSCTAVSSVEIVVNIDAIRRPSLLLAVTHNGLTLRAPVMCVWPYFMIDSTGLCHALSAGSIKLSSHLARDDAVVNLNVTMTLSFFLPGGTTFKTVSVTGLRFSSFNSATASAATCSNLDASGVVVSPFFTHSMGLLVLSFSMPSASAAPSSAIVCRISGFKNLLQPSNIDGNVQLSAFDGSGVLSHQMQRIYFPEILRPRVVSSVMPLWHPSTAQLRVLLYGANAGLSDWSGGLRIGATASVSTSWQSDTLVLGRSANGIGSDWSFTASVLLNQKSLTGAFSYPSATILLNSANFLFPLTGAVHVRADGTNFGMFNPSLSSNFDNSACQLSFWLSSSGIVSKVSGPLSRVTDVLNVVTVVRLKSFSQLSNRLFMFQNASVVNWAKQSNTPSTGGAHAFIFGQHFGGAAMSGNQRFTGSAVEATQWLSDSFIRLRTTGGVVLATTILAVSFPGQRIQSSTRASLISALSYDTPSPYVATSQRLSNISITGSNFGPYLAVIPSTTSCSATLPPNTVANICNSSALDRRDSGVTVTEAAVGVSFTRPVRLDDVVVSMLSPRGTEFKLMQNKCYGTLPCAGLDTISLKFLILPVGQLPAVPLVMCPSSGTYVPDDVVSLRLALSSQSAMGVWSLRVSTGSESQSISSAFIFFKTANLEFRIANAPVTSLSWFSDSSVSLKAPGYLDAQGIESSSGFGRNRTVTALSSGLSSPSSCTYAYPDPALNSAMIGRSLGASGNTVVQLLGRYFSNSFSNPRVRAGLSSCVATRWLSDTAITCSQAPSLGRILKFSLSIEKSAVADFSATSAFLPAQSVSGNRTFISAGTGASLVTVDGSGLGVWDSSARVRRSNGFSSAAMTMWLCDTLILTRIFPFVSNKSGITISLVSVVNNASDFSGPQLQPSVMAAYSKFNIPSTGSAVVVVFGAGFGTYSTSLRMSVSGSCCMESRWTSHSSVSCKSSSGYPSPVSSLPLFATSSGVSASGNGLVLAFDAAAVNRSADAISENAAVCFFNSSGCVSGRLVQLIQSSSGFGVSAFPLRQVRLVQGSQTRQCDNSSWLSDSSIHCLFSAAVSPEFRELQMVLEPASLQMSIVNPFYIPAPPPLSNETVQFRFFRNLMYPQGEDSRYREFGTTSGFQWPDSSFVSDIQHSEVLTFSFLIFIRASQYFMDSSFFPIQTNISATITVRGTTDVTSSILCDQAPFKQLSFSLLPRLFWAKVAVSLAFCTPKPLNAQSVTLHASVIVRNVNGELPLDVVSPSFRANSAGSASVTLTRQPSSQVSVASVYDEALGFRFNYGTDLDFACQQGGMGLFKYSILLICAGQRSFFRSRLPIAAGFIESNQCLQNITGISFIRPSKSCMFNISVLTDGIVFQTSHEFEVVPGLAKIAVLVGAGPFCASAGAVVWSMNMTSDGPCLVAQLQDVEGNNVASSVNATVVARSVNSSEPNYHVARSASNTSSTSGLIFWCDAYSSKTQNVGVIFGARVNGNITYWTSTVVNVSSAGPPSSLLPVDSATVVNGTLLPGSSAPKLSFRVEDPGGNSFVGSVRVAIRVRIVPRLNTSMGRSAASISVSSRVSARRLLQSSNLSTAACDRDNQLEFTFIQSSSSTDIVAGPEYLCRTGVNDIFFDVGTFDANVFSPTVSNAYSMSVAVSPGECRFFVLVNFEETFIAQSYSLIDSLEIMFIDAGLNEVSGNATMSLVSVNSSIFVYPAKSFSVVSNSSMRAYVPPFFLYAIDWIPSESSLKIGLTTSNSTVYPYRNIVTLHLNRSCSIGHYLVHSSHDVLYMQLSFNKASTNTSASETTSPLCAKCPNGTISNRFDARVCSACQAGTIPNRWSSVCTTCNGNSYKSNNVGDVCNPCPDRSFASTLRDTCLTFDFANSPSLVFPGKSIAISGISIQNAFGISPVANFSFMRVLVILAKKPFMEQTSVILSVNTTLNASTWTSPFASLPLNQVNPGSNFIWVLKLVEPAITDVYVSFDKSDVSVLDVSPTIQAFSPIDVPYTGSNFSLDCVPSAPSTAFFLPLFTVANVTNTSCVFHPATAGLASFSQPAHFSFISRSLISLRCQSLSSGQLGPPSSVWRVSAVFPDGRESPTSVKSLTVYCPAGMYIETNVTIACNTPPCCLTCPSPMSTSLAIDSIGLRSCICRPGYYGSGGLSCKACPRNAKFGFVCSTSGLLLPLVKPGFFIDYSLLSTCSEESCTAVIKCQNERACPGSGEKLCLTDANECYDNSAFGCIKCCNGFFMDNFVCRRCPSAQLPLLLGLALLGLILFVGISSSIDFPPILSVVSGMKVFMKGMQSFVGIRLFDVPWPSIVLYMFDFTRFFSFSIDILRPECTFSYNEDTKLASILIGPFVCVLSVALMMIMYTTFKCRRISRALEQPKLQQLLGWDFARSFKSTYSCIIVSALCLKFSAENMMRNGKLWNALNPTLIQRSDTLVLNQKVRRGAVAGAGGANASRLKSHDRLPGDWIDFRSAVSSFEFLDDFNRTTRRFRLMLSSALSIFVFTFQGSMEAALSTFDCSEGMLRKVPTVRCDVSDRLYVRLVVISIFGIMIYCVALPSCVALVLRSRWSRDAFIHDNMAYSQLVGFLTSLYNKNFYLWELVVCVNKVILISIPMFVSRNTVVQSLSTFNFMLIYMFFVVYLQPMQSGYLNKVEILSCVGVVVGAFASVFFIVELDGGPLLSGTAKDLVGLAFVIICSAAFSLSAKYIYQDFSRLFLMYNVRFARSWILDISARLGAAGTEGAYIPLVATLYNKISSSDISGLKRKLQIDLMDLEQHVPGRLRIVARCCAWFHRMRLSLWARRYKPSPDLLDQCLKQPELEALKYLQKLSERVATWERVSWKYFDVDKQHLPAEFREVKGDADPPLAEYSYQANVIHMLEDALPRDVHRVLTSLMFSHLMMMARPNLSPAEREYNFRMQEKLQEFAVSMSSISQIYFHILHAEQRRLNMLPMWRRVLSGHATKKDIFMRALARMSDLDIAKITEEALGYSLPHFQQQSSAPHDAILKKDKGYFSGESHRLFNASEDPSNIPLQMRSTANFSSPDDELQMTGMSSLSASSPASNTETEQSKHVNQSGFGRASGRHVSNFAKYDEQKEIPFENGSQCPKSLFELQEVVVHSADAAFDSSQQSVVQRRAISHHVPGDDAAQNASNASSSSAIDLCAEKTITAICEPVRHQRRDIGAKSLIAAIRRPVETEACDVTVKRIERGAVQSRSMADSGPKLAAQRVDGEECQAIVPPPPPRSRSCSRIRQPSGSANDFDAIDDVNNPQLRASQPDLIQSNRENRQISASVSSLSRHALPSPPQTRPSKAGHSRSSWLQNQRSDKPAPPDVVFRENMEATRGSDLRRSIISAAGGHSARKDIQLRHHGATFAGTPIEQTVQPDSRSHPRNTADSPSERPLASSVATSAPAVSHASESTVPVSAAMSPADTRSTTASPLQQRAAHDDTTPAAHSKRASKSRRMNSDGRPLSSWERKIDVSKSRFGDQFEEC